jgi:hypothetical protein
MIPAYTPAAKWLAIATVILAGLAGAYLKGREDATLASGGRIGALEQALADNDAVVVALRQENQRWRALTDRWRNAAEGAVARAAREEARLRAQNARLKRELDEVYREDPDAAQWAAVRVPAAVAGRLRQ